ncbi:MAG: HAD family hydrolase [Hydrogenophilales bacterium CG03_land_8_20_14_0_80_62_28]|nr:HAD-IA family hydrolase [Betaproteobacteria bacterium]OIO77178.1 MAG: HAD family hydrolase [Hydrogenophilaceae bacterium CG1_02_62_390]PIV22563.1 MAG: HAD family hydrolase [Hydrogenophilales bacterium CG03_land_8_20_14_0_80_62_28]PIW39340.1 MAG: HAD family hydrolase [Hydrogenophilales bacterium CG15_BIG_FIL_POST_REV_8_21_14_020_62_31]PIW71057.1 MAG: HAD family hydrolase [Hydrogenophilales bacterium CG12_big_fil_rev_8_21_14_0_65_61_21]PIX02293.1 MAG: HAD family hydrolase [Hydrogenophilales b
MSKRYDLLIFDWDGTLMDSADLIVASIQQASADLGWAVPSREAASHIIGLGLKEAIQTLFPDKPEADHPRLVERYRVHYLARDGDIALFDGAAELIRYLHGRGHILAVATGKARRGLQRAFEHSGLGLYFHASRTADETFSKPHPAMILELLDELMTPPERAIMIGDTSHDLEMARNAGIDALAAGYGAQPPEKLAEYRPVALCANFAKLASWLRDNA